MIFADLCSFKNMSSELNLSFILNIIMTVLSNSFFANRLIYSLSVHGSSSGKVML